VGLLLAAFPPLSWWPLALLAPWPLTLLALEARGPGRAFLRLYLAGLAIFLVGSWWLAETTWLNLLLVTVFEALYVGLYGWAARLVLTHRSAMPALPLLWTAHETLRLKVPLSGYPWQMLGHALAAHPVAVQAADLGGVLLLSFVAACGAALMLARQRHERGWRWAAAVLAAAAAYGLIRPATLEPPQPGPVLATVQPAFPQELKRSPASADERHQRMVEMSWEALRSGPAVDMLVWPETMWPWPTFGDGDAGAEWFPGWGPADAEGLHRETLGPLLADWRPPRGSGLMPLGDRAAALLLGTVWHFGEGVVAGRSANSAVLLDRSGRLLDRYDKHILVPAGETVPFGPWLPDWLRRQAEAWILSFAGWVPDLVPGPGPRILSLEGRPFGVTICFENAYGDHSRQMVAAGATFLVNLSNEAWFGTSTEFDHMELQSILRAVETRRALFRSTNSGISCLVRPDGRAPRGADRVERGGRDRAVAGILVAEIPLHGDWTLYRLWGDAWGWLCGLASLVLLVRRPRLP
jgi:apolipoprotein N-acyltransferase